MHLHHILSAFLFLPCFVTPVCAEENPDAAIHDVSGIYQVLKATLNESSCSQEGKEIEYASKFLRVTANGKNGYQVAICNGSSLDEVDCVGGYRSTHLKEEVSDGWQGYQYSSRASRNAKGEPQCFLHALRRKIVTTANGLIRYERTDWSENLSDFIAECDRPMAEKYSRYNSLKCNSHIVILGAKVSPVEIDQ